jgi:hypothetical protein
MICGIKGYSLVLAGHRWFVGAHFGPRESRGCIDMLRCAFPHMLGEGQTVTSSRNVVSEMIK